MTDTNTSQQAIISIIRNTATGHPNKGNVDLTKL